MILKNTLAVGAAIAVLGAGALGIGTTLASQHGQVGEGISGLVSAIAEKFNLDVEEVQAVFDEYHESHMEDVRADHEAKFEVMLAQAVEDGELTQEQVDAILEKMEELRGYMEEFKDLEPEERREAMQGHAEDLKAWAEENGIDMKYLRMGPAPQQGGQGPGGNGMGRPTEEPQEQS